MFLGYKRNSKLQKRKWNLQPCWRAGSTQAEKSAKLGLNWLCISGAISMLAKDFISFLVNLSSFYIPKGTVSPLSYPSHFGWIAIVDSNQFKISTTSTKNSSQNVYSSNAIFGSRNSSWCLLCLNFFKQLEVCITIWSTFPPLFLILVYTSTFCTAFPLLNLSLLLIYLMLIFR